ncbi:MAG: fasciclin domain-containing protein [Bacteroidaceae bacterium]|nr:fasciclin domain-containing protein [Bacteroidaceae bacterium]
MRFKSNLGLMGLAIATILTISTQNSCTEEMLQELEKQQQEQQPQSGDSIVTPPAKDSVLTIASYLEGNQDFSDFTYILKRSAMWDSLSTDSFYTCFALTNEAVQECLGEMQYSSSLENRPLFNSLETLTDSICTIIAKRHLVRGIIRFDTLQVGDGYFYRNNLMDEPLDRYVVFNENIEMGQDSYQQLRYYYIGNSKIIIVDMPVTNGIVQVIDHPFINRTPDLMSKFIPTLMWDNNSKGPNYLKAKIFYDALVRTRLRDTLEQYIDPEYYVDEDKTISYALMQSGPNYVFETPFENFYNVYPEMRHFKYTFFVVTDSILANEYGIYSVDDLERYAMDVYPEGAGLDNTLPESSLYQLMSYHILPVELGYDQLNTRQYEILNNRTMQDQMDVEDFYETMQPHSLMRISTPLDRGLERKGIYINRKGTLSANNLSYPGVRIWDSSESWEINTYALNGVCHFVDKLLLYNNNTRRALLTRIRVMASTLSPDFINSGARGRMLYMNTRTFDPSNFAYSFLPDYCKNFDLSRGALFCVTPRAKYYNFLYGDQVIFKDYDVTFRLPPVAMSATYEIRLWNNCGSQYATTDPNVQYYIRQGDGEFIECGAPIDLSLRADDPSIGYISDKQIRQENQYASEQQIQALIQENDDLMRSNGYMKSPDIYQTNNTNLRDDPQGYRVIVYRGYMDQGQDYYLRMKSSGNNTYFSFNFIELVPKDIFDGDEPEDRH